MVWNLSNHKIAVISNLSNQKFSLASFTLYTIFYRGYYREVDSDNESESETEPDEENLDLGFAWNEENLKIFKRQNGEVMEQLKDTIEDGKVPSHVEIPR